MNTAKSLLDVNLLFIAPLLVAFGGPANAQRPCSTVHINNTKTTTGNAAVSGAKSRDRATAATPSLIVTGGGQATITDPNGQKFTHQFAVSAVVNSDGSAHGEARFVFPLPFAQTWGALAGVDLMQLQGDLKTGSVDSTGAVTLVGPFLETDYSRADGIVFQENSSISGAPPMTLVISPGGKTFTLTWCAFIPPPGYFSVEVTAGNLKVR